MSESLSRAAKVDTSDDAELVSGGAPAVVATGGRPVDPPRDRSCPLSRRTS